jgi:hypothetical protein
MNINGNAPIAGVVEAWMSMEVKRIAHSVLLRSSATDISLAPPPTVLGFWMKK